MSQRSWLRSGVGCPSVAKKKPVDTVAALEAKLKQARGHVLTTSEASLVKRYDEAVVIEVREDLVLNMPKGVYCKLAGRHQRVVDDQAVRYEMPIDGPKIDLYQVLKRFHDILGEWGPTIRELQGEEGSLRTEKLRKEIELLERRSKSIELDIKNKQNEFIDRATLRIRMEWFSNKLRSFSEKLGRRFGGDAQVLFNTLLTQIEEELN
jgi:hypothetical protein